MASQLHRIQKLDPEVPKPPAMKLHSLPEIDINSPQQKPIKWQRCMGNSKFYNKPKKR